jgi:hypothetical protein
VDQPSAVDLDRRLRKARATKHCCRPPIHGVDYQPIA